MSPPKCWLHYCIALVVHLFFFVSAESPYRYFDWHVTYGHVYPLGVRQQGILINKQFPGPDIIAVTNDNLIINVFNHLDEPFLISCNDGLIPGTICCSSGTFPAFEGVMTLEDEVIVHWGLQNSTHDVLGSIFHRTHMDGVQQRKNSYEDGVYGTTCPIPIGKNFTYKLQVKDQIGSFFYFPSTAFHKAAGGFGGIRVLSRPLIPVPFPPPAEDFTLLIGDWYIKDHKKLKTILDYGKRLPYADGVHINGRRPNDATFAVQKGKTYRFRISNVGLQNTLNIRFQGHKMKLVEVEGTHTMQQLYSSLDIHVGQSYSVLVKADHDVRDYYIAVSTRFNELVHTTTAVLHYQGSTRPVSGPPPGGPTTEIGWSLEQARTIRTNLTASGPRPNPQGSYHYGEIPLNRTIKLVSSAAQVHEKQRYAVNSVSFIPADTPLKLADYFNIKGVFHVNSIPHHPTGKSMYLDTGVMGADYRTFVEIVFENKERIVQSWHLDGYNFFVVGMDGGKWSPKKRNQYNLHDAISRCTVQVYPRSWTAVYLSLDNVGMWNVRTQYWARQYLGQQFYLRVYTTSRSVRDEYPIPDNALLCDRASK